MKKVRLYLLTVLFLIFCGVTFSRAAAPGSDESLPDNVKTLLGQRCTGCHKGKHPPKGLNLEPDKIQAAIDAPSQEQPSLKIMDSANPESSYLLKKIRGDSDIAGGRMPLRRKALTEAEMDIIKTWLQELIKNEDSGPIFNSPGGEGDQQTSAQVRPAGRQPFEKPAFWGTRLINLPTTTTMDKNDFLIRISHRFLPKTDSGYDSFYGFDGPAIVFISLGYGITDNLGVTLGRSNLFQEWEFSASWLVAEQGKTASLPVSAALHTGLVWASWKYGDRSRLDSKNFKVDLQLSLSRQVTRRWSLMVVPSFSTNTDHWAPNSSGTFAVGLGTRYMFLEDLSVLVEWIPVISGYKNVQNGWGLGIEKKIGGHVFQLFVANSFGMTSDQFIPGGDLRLNDFDFRFGFNIFRTF